MNGESEIAGRDVQWIVHKLCLLPLDRRLVLAVTLGSLAVQNRPEALRAGVRFFLH